MYAISTTSANFISKNRIEKRLLYQILHHMFHLPLR